jgi:nicotinamide-nucleotide amidase
VSVAILSIGTEVTRGEIVDTNSSFLAAALTEAGFDVGGKAAVADDVATIAATLRRMSTEHEVVVVTGGLGPTSDDLTAQAAASAASVELVRDESALLAIRRRVEARGRVVTPHHEKQADLPRGAEVLTNSDGTAPGFSLRLGGATFFFMPGVPREMKRMFREQVLPRIGPSAPRKTHVVRLRTFGLPESLAQELLSEVESRFPGVTLGYRLHAPELDIKVFARAESYDEARATSTECAAFVTRILGDVVFGEGDDDLPLITSRALRARGFRLALAESCTGGLISSLLTAHAGASDFLIGSAVVYANSAKTRMLSVSEDTLRGHGAVSAEVAAEMAQGARRVCEVDVGLSVTGVAGPGGGTTHKPVGLVYWAVAHPGGTIVRERVFHGDRREIQLQAAYSALDLVRRVASGLSDQADPPPSQRPPTR